MAEKRLIYEMSHMTCVREQHVRNFLLVADFSEEIPNKYWREIEWFQQTFETAKNCVFPFYMTVFWSFTRVTEIISQKNRLVERMDATNMRFHKNPVSV